MIVNFSNVLEQTRHLVCPSPIARSSFTPKGDDRPLSTSPLKARRASPEHSSGSEAESDDDSQSSMTPSEVSLDHQVSETKDAPTQAVDDTKASSKKGKKNKKKKGSFFSSLFSKSSKSSPKKSTEALQEQVRTGKASPAGKDTSDVDVKDSPGKGSKESKKSKSGNPMEALEQFAKKHVRRNKSPSSKEPENEDAENSGTLKRIAKGHAAKHTEDITKDGKISEQSSPNVGSAKKEDVGYISSSPAEMSASSSRSAPRIESSRSEDSTIVSKESSLSDDKEALKLEFDISKPKEIALEKRDVNIDEIKRKPEYEPKDASLEPPKPVGRSIFSVLSSSEPVKTKTANQLNDIPVGKATEIEKPIAKTSRREDLEPVAGSRKDTYTKSNVEDKTKNALNSSSAADKTTKPSIQTECVVEKAKASESVKVKANEIEKRIQSEKTVNADSLASNDKKKPKTVDKDPVIQMSRLGVSDLPKSKSVSDPNFDSLKRSTSPYQRPTSCADDWVCIGSRLLLVVL